mgnify:CR=1 FL=1
MRKQQIKQLNNAYKKSFNTLNKHLLTTKTAGLSIFVEHLRYLRDLMILNASGSFEEESEDNIDIVTITTAIAEYEASTYSAEQKGFHWNNFCELVKQNMEDWLELNDSI